MNDDGTAKVMPGEDVVLPEAAVSRDTLVFQGEAAGNVLDHECNVLGASLFLLVFSKK